LAHLWVQDACGWEALKLDAAQFELGAITTAQVGDAKPRASAKGAWLIRADAGGPRAWALVASHDSDVRVNGRAVVAGVCVLADRDEIRIGGIQQFFSTETLATVQEFPPLERPVFCGRCRQKIEVGSPSVRCPGARCSIFYHQSSDLPCFTYADKCNFCGHSTALDAGFSWVPEA
jgi:hypothetical protein